MKNTSDDSTIGTIWSPSLNFDTSKIAISSFRGGNRAKSSKRCILGTRRGLGEWVILDLTDHIGSNIYLDIESSNNDHMNAYFHVQRWTGGGVPELFEIAQSNTATLSYINPGNPVSYSTTNDHDDPVLQTGSGYEETIQKIAPEPQTGWVEVATWESNTAKNDLFTSFQV